MPKCDKEERRILYIDESFMFIDLEKISYLIQVGLGKIYIKIEDDYQEFLESD